MSHSKHNAKVRFLHNVQGAPNVNVYLNGIAVVLNLKYQDFTAYLNVSNGKSNVKVTTTDGTELLRTSANLRESETYTVVVAGDVNDLTTLQPLVFEDDNACPRPGHSHIRFIHGVFGAPNVDVYIGEQKIFNDVAFGQTGTPEYIALKLGTMKNGKYSVSVKVAGTNNTVVGPLQISFNSGAVYTIVASGTVSKGLSAVLSNDNQGKCQILKAHFDSQSYMGKWYQISSIPQFFGAQCVRSTAEYTLLNNGINVFNTCYDKNNKAINTITGTAVPVNPCEPAALRVSFPNQGNEGNSGEGANYLVQMTDYVSYVIVGSPNLTSLFILSRSSTMSKDKYNKILHKVKQLGYNVDNIKVDRGAVH